MGLCLGRIAGDVSRIGGVRAHGQGVDTVGDGDLLAGRLVLLNSIGQKRVTVVVVGDGLRPDSLADAINSLRLIGESVAGLRPHPKPSRGIDG